MCVDRVGQAAARPGQDGPVCQCVGVCVLTERDKLQQDLAKMDQFVSVLRAGQAAARPGQDGPVCQCVGVCVLTERDKLQQDLAKMDQFVSVLVCVC